MSATLTIPPADIHTPEELLENAESLFDGNNPKMMRAAVLEAITALECYVHRTVFSSLDEKLDSLLVRWLEEKTRNDFDARLCVLTPVAIGQTVDKKAKLWGDYKKAKEIRNKIVHKGRRVSPSDARFVIDTVYDWLAYLGSTLELELSLLRLKDYVEENRIPIHTFGAAFDLICQYFPAAEKNLRPIQLEDSSILIKIGPFNTSVDVMFLSVPQPQAVPSAWAPFLEEKFILEKASKLPTQGLYQKVVIVFLWGELEERYRRKIFKVPMPSKQSEGSKWLHVVIIQLPDA